MIEKPEKAYPIEPVWTHMLVRLIPETKTEGGIDLPDGVRLKNRCKVIAVGRGRITESGTIIPLCCKPGDFIIAALPPGLPIIEQNATLGDVVLISEQMVFAIDRREAELVPRIAVPGSRSVQ